MLYIDDTERHIALAKENHYDHLKCYINRKIGGDVCDDGTCEICVSKLQAADNIDDIIPFLQNIDNVSIVLNGNPVDLLAINAQFWAIFFPTNLHPNIFLYFNKKNKDLTNALGANTREALRISAQLNRVINYSWFANKDHNFYNAYDLTRGLARNTCTYCNRVYTNTVIKKRDGSRIIRPTLDHWFPKAEFPLLALSFYNLIPSCSTCNSSVKGTDHFNFTDHVHPYLDRDQVNQFEFNYFLCNKDKYRIFMKNTGFGQNRTIATLEAMSMDEIYNSHHAELEDLLMIKKNYTASYIKNMQSLTKGKLSPQDLYRLLFGVSFESIEYFKLPLSKFKYDILKQLEMLKEIEGALK